MRRGSQEDVNTTSEPTPGPGLSPGHTEAARPPGALGPVGRQTRLWALIAQCSDGNSGLRAAGWGAVVREGSWEVMMTGRGLRGKVRIRTDVAKG